MIDRLKKIAEASLPDPFYRRLREIGASWFHRSRRFATRGQLAGYDRFHLGAGPHQIPGWANIDIYGRANLIWDLRKPLPVGKGRIRYVYAEHFIEHISRDEGLHLLRSLRALLHEEGVVRLSTPDLSFFAAAYLNGEVIRSLQYQWLPTTPCEMMNDQMRQWGHQFVYDEPELRALLAEAGYREVKRVGWRESDHDALRGIETRPSLGDLIVEAR